MMKSTPLLIRVFRIAFNAFHKKLQNILPPIRLRRGFSPRAVPKYFLNHFQIHWKLDVFELCFRGKEWIESLCWSLVCYHFSYNTLSCLGFSCWRFPPPKILVDGIPECRYWNTYPTNLSLNPSLTSNPEYIIQNDVCFINRPYHLLTRSVYNIHFQLNLRPFCSDNFQWPFEPGNFRDT